MSDADRERIKNKYPDSYTRIDAIINLEAHLAESQRREGLLRDELKSTLKAINGWWASGFLYARYAEPGDISEYAKVTQRLQAAIDGGAGEAE